MFTETVTYEDFNGNQQSETLYFNLSKKEMMDLQYSVDGGFDKKLETIVSSGNEAEIMKTFISFIELSYGVKSEDGRRFIKSEEVTEEFMNSLAFEAFLNKLTDGDEAYVNSFVSGIMPRDLVAKANQPVLASA